MKPIQSMFADPWTLALGRVGFFLAFGAVAWHQGADRPPWSPEPNWRLIIGGAFCWGAALWFLLAFLFTRIRVNRTAGTVSLRRFDLLEDGDWDGPLDAVEYVVLQPQPRKLFKAPRLELQLRGGQRIPAGTFATTLGLEDHAQDLATMLNCGVLMNQSPED